MRILFIHNYYRQRGGEDVAFEKESKLLKDRGHDVHAIVFKNKSFNTLPGKLRGGFSALYNFAAAGKLKKVIKTFKPDIIHIHNIFFVASPSVLFVAKKLRIPVVLTLHNYRLICCNALLLRDNRICELCINKKLPKYGIKYKCYRGSSVESALVTAITGMHKLLETWKKKITAYIVLTEFAKQRLLHSSLGALEDQMKIKPNFTDDPGNGTLPRENYFLFAGRISPEKGIESLLEAFAGMPEYKLMIAGDGSEKERLQIKYQGNSNIIFAGQISGKELPGLMRHCKALIIPSLWYEMLPLTIIEAFATGTPVLASNHASLSEIVQHGYNGMCFKPGDVNDIRDKVSSFALHANANTHMYTNARQTYIDKYHPDIHYNSVLTIYKNAILRNEASN